MIFKSIKKFKKLILTIILYFKNKKSFLDFYKDTMNYYARKDLIFAVGVLDDFGREIGKSQLEFFFSQGLKPYHKLLNIGY